MPGLPGGSARLNLLPRGVLLHGPPGTGKTWSMRALAGEAGLPVVELPIDGVLTKWYGESERRLASVFRLCRQAGRMILLIDEIDALARHRRDAHEASARLVSILLMELDGLGGAGDLVLVGAANELSGIDAAVLSRFDVQIEFGRRALVCRGSGSHPTRSRRPASTPEGGLSGGAGRRRFGGQARGLTLSCRNSGARLAPFGQTSVRSSG